MNVRKLLAPFCLGLALALVGCGQDRLPVHTTVHLMDDPVMLQAVLTRCNQSGDLRDAECRNAREAVDRLAEERPAEAQQKEALAQAEFERAREELRQRAERDRQRQAALQRVDPYTMPLVSDAPMDAAPQAQTR
jgi:hypothetical protein